jgi:hypothetical protein
MDPKLAALHDSYDKHAHVNMFPDVTIYGFGLCACYCGRHSITDNSGHRYSVSADFAAAYSRIVAGGADRQDDEWQLIRTTINLLETNIWV